MKKLKKKCGISSNYQFVIILIVFAITGSLSLIVSSPILDFMGIYNSKDLSVGGLNPWLYHPLRLLIVFPVYQVLILLIGTIFGQHKFFWWFIKKMLPFLK